MRKSKVCFASALLVTLLISACSGSNSTAPTTTFGTVPGPAQTLPTIPPGTLPSDTTPLTPVLSSVDASTTTATTAPTVTTASSSSSSTTTDWEVVGGIFTTKAAAQSQIDKLTAAKFTGFSLKAVGAKTAAVLPGLTKSAATTMAGKINTAGVATATTFHLSSSSAAASTTTDWEVVGGIFTTKAAAQSQIDKLTAAKFTGFSLKAVGAKTAAVLPGLTKAEATALASKINKAGVATATTFQLSSSSATGATTTTTTTTTPSTTATNYEVVDGIFTTKATAQAQIDKLTAGKFPDFTIKPITGKFAVVKADLTKTEATDLVTKINAANLGPARVKAL